MPTCNSQFWNNMEEEEEEEEQWTDGRRTVTSVARGWVGRRQRLGEGRCPKEEEDEASGKT